MVKIKKILVDHTPGFEIDIPNGDLPVDADLRKVLKVMLKLTGWELPWVYN